MIDILKTLAALGLGYLLGSLNTAVIVGKVYGKDIRSHGSKSAGLTNTLRVLGKSAAVMVLAGDILKGIVACLIGLQLGVYVHSGQATDCISLLAAGAGAVMGHNWPVYFGFKGRQGRPYGRGRDVHDQLADGADQPRRLRADHRPDALCFPGHDVCCGVLRGHFVHTGLRRAPFTSTSSRP